MPTAAITVANMVDLTNMTLEELGQGRFTQLWPDITRYEVLPRLLKKDKVMFRGGDFIRHNVMLNDSDVARQVGLYDVDKVNVPDLLTHIRVDWRHTTWNWAWERREALMQRGPHEIVNLIRARRTGAMGSLVKHMEKLFWNAPTDPNDLLDPLGVPYWITDRSAAGAGFVSDLYGSHTAIGNLSPTTNEAWRNYGATYTLIDEDDFLKKARDAYRDIFFETPLDVRDYRRGRGQSYRCYAGSTLIDALGSIARASNDDLGAELAEFDGTTTFKRHPIIYVPKLNSKTNQPFYMINFDYFYIVCLQGDYMHEEGAMRAPWQHTAVVVHADMTWAILCDDRRRQAVLHTI